MAAFTTNRELLNVHFEGYKLSSSSLTRIRKTLADPVRIAKLKDDEFSYQHVRAHTLHNYLYCDPSSPYSVYWCDNEGSVIKGTLSNDVLSTQNVFSHSTSKVESWTNFTMSFLGNEMGVSCAGGDRIILFKREECPSTETAASERWCVLTSVTAGDSGEPVMIVTAGLGATGSHVDILCAQFSSSSGKEKAPTSKQGNVSVVYKWLRINLGVNSSVTGHVRAEDVVDHSVMCEIRSRSHMLYTAFQHEPTTMTTQLLLMTETTPTPTALSGPTESSRLQKKGTSEKRVLCGGSDSNGAGTGDKFEEPDRHCGLGYKDDESEKYQWSQTEEDVVISFQLQEDVTKKDVWCVMERGEVGVGLSDGKTLLRGELAHDIDPEGSTWTIDQNM